MIADCCCGLVPSQVVVNIELVDRKPAGTIRLGSKWQSVPPFPSRKDFPIGGVIGVSRCRTLKE